MAAFHQKKQIDQDQLLRSWKKLSLSNSAPSKAGPFVCCTLRNHLIQVFFVKNSALDFLRTSVGFKFQKSKHLKKIGPYYAKNNKFDSAVFIEIQIFHTFCNNAMAINHIPPFACLAVFRLAWSSTRLKVFFY